MVTKKHIAFFTENLYGGGVERILQTILRYFDYNRFDVTLYSNKCEDVDPLLYPFDVHYHYVFDSIHNTDNPIRVLFKKICNKIKLIIYYNFSARLFYSLFIRKRYEVGIAFIEGYATRILSGAPSSMRKVAWIHIELSTYHWTKVAYRSVAEESDTYSLINKVICVSKIVKSQFEDLFGYHDKALVIYNPIDRNLIIELSKKYRDSIHKKHDIQISAVGSLTKRKGFDRLLSVLYDIVSEGIDCGLWIIGEGVEKQELERTIMERHLVMYADLLGYKSNPYPYMAASDIYVCSSFAEGYNTAITEALILGKPIVSTDCSGVREQLGDSEYGIVVENDNKSLLKGLQLMVRDSSIRQHYSFKASERGLFYCAEDVVAEIEDLL